MKPSAYATRDYPFGQRMLTLRTRIGLTQAGLAAVLHVSRRAVALWEAGHTYPTAHHLQALIALGVRQVAFPLESTEADIRTLWRAAHQKMPLDETWLMHLLVRSTDHRASGALLAAHHATAAGPKASLWTIPYARNPHFTGREDILILLMQQLAPLNAAGFGPTSAVALTQSHIVRGLGGVGKTQIAVEYAYRAREQHCYRHTLWINASTEEAILQDLSSLADDLPSFVNPGKANQQKLVQAVLRWFEDCPHAWLLIFDNADDLTFIQAYLPLRGRGSVLITTRASAVGTLAAAIEVDVVGDSEGTEMLLRCAGRYGHATTDEIAVARIIADTLGQFPLAIDQAGAYIEETGCNVQDYLGIYQQHRHELLARRGRLAQQYPASVTTTWALAFQQIERKNPAAAQLLALCALLAPDHIPEELLIKGAPFWPDALHQAVIDPFLFNQMLETLLAFSLVKRLAEDRLLSIHRLVQAVQLDRLSWAEQQQWATGIVRAAHAIFPHDSTDMTLWPQCQRYLDQMMVCDGLVHTYDIQLAEAAAVFDRTASYLLERTLYSMAEPLFRHALAIKEKQEPIDVQAKALTLCKIAKMLRRQGKDAASEAMHLRALQLREQHLGPLHLEVADSLNLLSGLYCTQGRYDEAEVFCLRGLIIRKQQLSLNDLLIADSLIYLGMIYENMGRYSEAEVASQRAMEIREEHLGPVHPLVANAMMYLGTVYSSLGRCAEAQTLLQQSVQLMEQQVGPNYPWLVPACASLGRNAIQQGDYALAEQASQRALDLAERFVGPDHYMLLYPLLCLAIVATAQSNFTKAERLFARTLQICETQPWMDQPKFMLTLYHLAQMWHAQGCHSEAETHLQRALHAWEESGQTEYPAIALIAYDLARLAEDLGNAAEAVRCYQCALTIQEAVFGGTHPQTNATRKAMEQVSVPLLKRRTIGTSRTFAYLLSDRRSGQNDKHGERL